MKAFFTSLLIAIPMMTLLAQGPIDEMARFDQLEEEEPYVGDKGANPKFHQLLDLSKKLNLPIKERYYMAEIMIDHYAKRRKDSCLYYLQKIKIMVDKAEDVMSSEEKIRLYQDVAYTESNFFGYNLSVTQYLGEAYELALVNQDDYAIFYILNNMAEQLLLQDTATMDQIDSIILDIEKAIKKYPKSYYKLEAYTMLTKLYFEKNDLETAKVWIDKTLQTEAEDDFYKYIQWIAKDLLSYYFYKKREVYKALDILNAAMSDFTPFYNNEDELTMIYYRYFLYYSYIDETDKALSFITKASKAPLSIYEKIYYKDKLVAYAYTLKKYALAEKLNQEKLELQSEISTKEDKVITSFFINELQKKNLEVTQKALLNENLKLEKQSAERKTQLSIVIKILILVLIGIILYLIRKKLKKKDETIISLRNKEAEILSDLVTQRENELQLIAIKLSNRMMMLQGVKDTLEDVKEKNPEMNTLRTKIDQLMLSGAELAEVSDRLQKQYPGIYSNLKESHPELSETEIKYCLLTKLNLSLKETASILMVSADTVKHNRSRIKRKMSISKEFTLKDYMDQISNEKKIVA